MKRIFLIVVVFLISTINALGQVSSSSEIGIPSPQARAFAKYGDVPISLYSGKAQISIPLYTIASNNISVPISLSYNTQGVRVQEENGWVGINWSLNAGGVITRAVKGNPDDRSDGYLTSGDDYCNSNCTPQDFRFLNLVEEMKDQADDSLFLQNTSAYLTGNLAYNDDPEMDIFYYNISGSAGKFVIEPNSGSTNWEDYVHTIPKSNNIIKPIFNNTDEIESFEVITSDGTTYTFGGTPTALEENDQSDDYITAWYLTKIESALGDSEVNIEYVKTSSAVVESIYGQQEEYIGQSSINTPSNVNSDGRVTQNTRAYVSKIIGSEKTAHFIQTGTLSGELEKIEIRMTGDNSLISVLETEINTVTSREYLDKVIIKGANEEKLNEYSFEYYSRNLLPFRDSKGVDFWGYYNGKVTNTGYIPYLFADFSVLDGSGNTTSYSINGFHDGADRNVNSSTIHYGSLKRIIYPTGGSLELQYEPNNYSEVVHNDTRVGLFRSNTTTLLTTPPVQIKTETFDFSDNNMSQIEAEVTFDISQHDNAIKAEFPNCVPNSITPSDTSGSYYETKTKVLECVDSNITASINRGSNTNNIVKLVSKTLEYPSPFFRDGPGLRVKKMISDDGNLSTDPTITKYVYEDANRSWGTIFRQPNHEILYYYTDDDDDVYVVFYGRVSNEIGGLGDEESSVGYEKVIVLHGENGEYGSEEHVFTTAFPDYGSINTIVEDDMAAISYQETSDIITVGANPAYFNGVKAQERIFDSSDNLISEKLYSHKFYDKNTDLSNSNVLKRFPQIKFKRFPVQGISSTNYPISIGLGYLYSMWTHPTGETISIYNGENDPVITSTGYLYEDDSHKQLTKKVETNSLFGEKRVTNYEYAHEQNGTSGSPDYSEMKTLNMLSQPYSVLVEDGSGTDVSKSWTTWDEWATGQWLPQEQWVWEGTGTAPATPSSSAIKTTEILSYDSYGNPLEIQSGTGSNASVTKAFYGSNSQPFQNATTTGNAVNGVLGVYLTGIQKVNGTEDVITGGVRATSGDDLFSEASYDGIGRVISKTDENEQSMRYGYDSFNRLITQTNTNGLVVGATGYGYSASRNAGSFASDDPNTVMSIAYVDPFYATDFTTNDGWTGSLSKATFNYEFNGEKVVRLGTPGGSTVNLKKNSGVSSLVLRTDVYISSSVIGTPPVVMFNNGNSSNNTKRRFGFEYITALDQFRINTRRYGETEYTYSDTLSLDAQPDRWYTIEIEKEGSTIKGWLYPRGGTRSEEYAVEAVGFSASWQPTVESIVGNNYIYISNFSIAKATQTSVSYLDGLGREIQTQVRGGDKVIATETLYNDRGLPEISARPIERTSVQLPGFFDSGLLEDGVAFSAGNATNANAPVASHYAQYHTGTGDDSELYAYSYTQYENSPLARVEKSTLPGEDHQTVASQAITTTYGLNTTESFTINGKSWGLNSLSKTVSKDPEGNETITYTNGWGQTIVSGVNMNPTGDDVLDKSTSDLVTYFEYDTRGNLVRVEDPRGLATTYSYNTLGQLESKKLPDQTLPHTYKYDDKGRLRFHMDPNLDAASNYYYYTKYDELDRVTETGRRNSANEFSDEPSINDQSFPSSTHTPYVYYYYDGDNPLSGHTPNHTKGRLTKVLYKDPNSSYSGATFYSYNSLGLVEWVIQQPAQPTSSNNRKIEYSYDELGRMTRMYFNPLSSSSDDHYFWYYYDELGRLEKVTSYGSNAESSALIEAEYTYYADGQVERLILGDGAQTVDYDYTIQGWLEDINNGAASGSDQFGMTLDYANNGNISEQHWVQAAFSTSTYKYFYDYDSANRLQKACYGSTNSCTSTGDYDVTYGYDKNGNIHTIKRNSSGSDPDMDYYVSFVTGTNKVDDVRVDGISSATKQYSYDASGNVTENGVQGITSTTYDWRNLPTTMAANGSILTYLYDGDGNRVKKQVGSTATWYVRGADGQTIAAYDASGTLLFINILAGGQIIGQIEN